jgi:predicted HTH domain antitoxin
MSLEIAIPSHIEKHLQSEWGNELPRRAAEAVAIEGYRSGALSLGEVAEMLSLSINEADGFLKERGIFAIENIDEVEADNRTLEELLTE